MSKVQNKDIINSIRNEQSEEFKNVVPKADGKNDTEILQVLKDYPTQKNIFINTLVNKIGRQLFFNKVYNNPFKMLHKGELPYGKSIEEIFVENAIAKGYDEHFTTGGTNESDLIGVLAPSVKTEYITENFQHKFKTSLSDQLLKGAFMNQTGLSDMLTNIVNALYSGVEAQEYQDIRDILFTSIKEVETSAKQSMIVATTDTKDLAKNIKKYSSKMKFITNEYNLTGVDTFANKSDLVLFATVDTVADIDIDVLAYAFNIDKAEVNVRVIEVDTLGTINGKEVKCLLADKDMVQAYDTLNETSQFYNGDKLVTNIFAHKHGIMAFSKFANMVVFTG